MFWDHRGETSLDLLALRLCPGCLADAIRKLATPGFFVGPPEQDVLQRLEIANLLLRHGGELSGQSPCRDKQLGRTADR